MTTSPMIACAPPWANVWRHSVINKRCISAPLAWFMGRRCRAGTALAEVDSVLATTEVQQLLDEEGVALAALPEAAVDLTAAGTSGEGDGVYGYPGGAGGYLEFVFRCGQSLRLGSG